MVRTQELIPKQRLLATSHTQSPKQLLSESERQLLSLQLAVTRPGHGIVQPAPDQYSLQRHRVPFVTPLTQGSEQASPCFPSSQRSQFSPTHPGEQRHVASLWHDPCWLQGTSPPGHRNVQLSPAHPCPRSHRHFPLVALHLPTLLHTRPSSVVGHLNSHPSPAYPKKHVQTDVSGSHTPFKLHTPSPLQPISQAAPEKPRLQ